MADGRREQEERHHRRPIADPRLQREMRSLTPLEIAALWSGWVAVALILTLVFWLAVNPAFTFWQKVLLGIGIALAVFWGVVHRGTILGASRTRGVRIGANSALFTVFVFGILVLLNIVASRHHIRRDITETQRFSLSEQTRQVVEGLEEELSIIAFLTQPEPPALRHLLREYNMLSPKVTLHIYDPLLDAEKAREYNIRSSTSSVVVVQSGDREEKIYGGEEEQLTSAILAVSGGERTRVYFLTGHGERSLDERDGTGLGTIESSLENQQFSVETLNLAIAEQPEIPADCAVLVIAGPTQPIREEVMDAISAYAHQGGNLLLAVDGGGPKMTELLEPQGVRVLDGIVYDRSYGFLGASEIPMATVASDHRIVEQLDRVALAMPTVAALDILDPSMDEAGDPYMSPPSSNAKPLLETSREAWLEPFEPQEGEVDTRARGPFTLAAVIDAGDAPDPMGMPGAGGDGMRMVVLGDADMMTDQFINLGLVGNAHMVLNSINWLAENEKLITIPPRDDMPRFMVMSSAQRNLIWVISVGVIPLLIMIAGFIVWWRRR